MYTEYIICKKYAIHSFICILTLAIDTCEVGKMPLTTNFGALREAYDTARPHYAQQVIDYVVSFCHGKVLDVGCGTGIATRQLAEKGIHIVGCDGDERMIEVARRYTTPAIDYFVAPADAMPFQNNEFDVVTAFGAFHFFYNSESVAEIKRVLKHQGLFVVTEGMRGNHEPDYFRECVEEVIARPLPRPSIINVGEVFRNNGLEEIAQREFQYELQFPFDKFLEYMQSRRYWNNVHENERPAVVAHVRERFSERYPSLVIPVPRHYQVVVGKSV